MPPASTPGRPLTRAEGVRVEWIRFVELGRHYGAQSVFECAGGVVRDRERIGIVGANGSGKSSLLRILAGIDEPDAGTVTRARDLRIGYLAQDAVPDESITLRGVLTSAFARVADDEREVRRLEAELTAAAERGDGARGERLLRAYGEAREIFDRHGGEGLERRVRSMLSVFSFDEDDLDRPASDFSGGQRTRAALARVLLEEPDVLLLDEPTNHLDLESVRWLEDFLVDDPRACVLVSHDRYVLERVCTRIWELERGTLEDYETAPGRAYTEYREQKTIRREEAQRMHDSALTEDRRRRAVIAELRTHGSHNYAQVRSREKQLGKSIVPDAPQRQKAPIAVRLSAARRATAGIAVTARRLAKSYASLLFKDLSFELARGERLAVVGDNGSGKSTLLAILGGTLVPDSGSVRVSEGVQVASFSQDSADELPAGRTAVEAVLEAAPIVPQEARALLGRMNLGGDAADKPVEAFSGGERRRIMLARLMARAADCLLLDEPTNDLDIASREALEEVLAAYGGALVVVSHDRYLLARIAERVLWLNDGAATMFDGYDAYERARRGDLPPEPPKPRLTGRSAPVDAEREERLRKARLARDLAAAEEEVARLDRRKAEIELEFADPGAYDDREHVAALTQELRDVETASAAALARWEALAQA
jgi:ATP-binding cassette, subfamily F, member 3